MRELLNLGGRLLLFTLVAGILLAATNMVTEGPIADQAVQAAQEAQRAALPGAEDFAGAEVVDPDGEYPLLTGLSEGKVGDQVVGYVFTAAPVGYGGPIPITMGIGTDGSIHGVVVGALEETSGLGSRVAEEPFLSQYTALAADPEVIGREVDTISGATVSSAPFKEATRQMTAYAVDVLGVEPNPGQPPLSEDDLARQQQLPDAKSFEQVNPMLLLGDYDTIRAIYRGASGEDTVGYIFELAPQGYIDVIHLRLAIGEDGSIAALEVLSNSESEEYGQRISREPEFIDSFLGKSADAAAIAGIDALSGATGTSDAVKGSVAQAAAFYRAYLAPGATGEAAQPEEGGEGPDAVSEATGEAEATDAPEGTPEPATGNTSAPGDGADDTSGATSDTSGGTAAEEGAK